MKNQWLAYLVVAGISVFAGLAIAGRPSTGGKTATITTPTTVAPAPTTSAPPSTEAVTVDTEPPTSEVPPDTAAASTSTTTTLPPGPAAEDVAVVAVNGAGTSGVAGRTRDELVFFGFTQTRVTDATLFVDDTFVYFADGFEASANDIATILGLDTDRVRPIAEAPDYGAEDGDQVVVYAGRDQN